MEDLFGVRVKNVSILTEKFVSFGNVCIFAGLNYELILYNIANYKLKYK